MTSFSQTGRPTNLVRADTSSLDPLLVKLLNSCTPHHHEQHITSIIKSQEYVKNNAKQKLFDKEMNNQIIVVGDSETVFSCHMDIVGDISKGNKDKGKIDTIFLMEDTSTQLKRGFYYGAKGYYNKEGLIDTYEGCPLGADDKVGVYILLKMIEAKIPGVYLFHTGEECGGLGSKSLAENHPKIFHGIKRAIAFDRAGYGDIIAYQRNSRCCSTVFGEALAKELNRTMPPQQIFKNEVHGSFTDTASYTKLIPECTNVSVGYFNQHGQEEYFDYIWLKNFLLPAVLLVKYEDLPTKRNPKEVTTYSYGNYNNIHALTKKKSWKEATSITPYMEFPEWNPELGFVQEAAPAVLRTALGRYITKLSFGAEKDAFMDYLANLLEFTEIQKEEIEHLHNTIDKLMGVERPTTSVDDRRSLLTRLVTVSIQHEEDLLTEELDRWIKSYIKGAKKLLLKTSAKEVLSEKELTRYNRIIFSLGTLLDCTESPDSILQTLLDDVEKYIIANEHEEGFEINNKNIPTWKSTHTKQEDIVIPQEEFMYDVY